MKLGELAQIRLSFFYIFLNLFSDFRIDSKIYSPVILD